MIDAGFSSMSGFDANSVSPRVTDVTITPQRPLRVCAARIPARTVFNAAAPRGDDHEVGAGAERAVRTGVRRAVRRREGLRRCCGATEGAFFAASPTAATERGPGVAFATCASPLE